MRVNVKWGKQLFKDVEVDLENAPILFKYQLYSMSDVPPDRQKIIVKAKVLGDESWEDVQIRDGQTILLMGSSAAPMAAPSQPIVFVEDLPVEEQDLYDLKKYGAGLENLGNTCYMNSTLQLLYSVPELRSSLEQYHSDGNSSAADPSSRLTMAAGDLFANMTRSGNSVMPGGFLLALRNKYPQFAELGQGGVHRQQDAEECFSQVMHSLSEKLKIDPNDTQSASQISRLFGVGLETKLKCVETDEPVTEHKTETKILCNIPQRPPVEHVHEGIREGLRGDREQHSVIAGREMLFEGKSEITHLSPYLIVHMVRFSYRIDTQRRAKILKKISFPAVLDLFEFCSEDYKKQLEPARKVHEELKDKEILAKGEGSSKQEEVPQSSEASSSVIKKSLTGCFDLMGVITHRGRSSNSGHYVSWVKQEDNQWVQFDDDALSLKKQDEIMQLSGGGGDWHMAYILLYKAQTVNVPQDPASMEVEMKD